MKTDSKSQAPIGRDPTLEYMKAQGIPLTRANYLQQTGLTEPLEAEHAGYVRSLQLDDTRRPETKEIPEDQDPRVGALRIARFKHQNAQMLKQAKPKT